MFVEFQRSGKINELSCENATQVLRYMNALLEKISSLSVQEVCSASGFFHGCLKIHSAQIQSFLSHMRVWFRLNFMRLCMPDNYCQLEWVQLCHFQQFCNILFKTEIIREIVEFQHFLSFVLGKQSSSIFLESSLWLLVYFNLDNRF